MRLQCISMHTNWKDGEFKENTLHTLHRHINHKICSLRLIDFSYTFNDLANVGRVCFTWSYTLSSPCFPSLATSFLCIVYDSIQIIATANLLNYQSLTLCDNKKNILNRNLHTSVRVWVCVWFLFRELESKPTSNKQVLVSPCLSPTHSFFLGLSNSSSFFPSSVNAAVGVGIIVFVYFVVVSLSLTHTHLFHWRTIN